MATYKLIQDIEAEDKILGPLTLRQFIFALITAFLLYLCFFSIEKGVLFLLIIFLPPAILTGFFAFPFGRDQPTEVWALAKLRFWFKPRSRVWDQSGVKELVTITVPKRIQHNYTDGLSQSEVKSRLSTLANTIDSRGWAVKDVAVNDYTPATVMVDDSDRLLNIDAVPQEVSDSPVLASDDILDEQNNPIAHQFDDMIHKSSVARRQQLIDKLNSNVTEPAAPSSAQWFMPARTTGSDALATPPIDSGVAAAPDDPNLSARLRARSATQNVAYGNLRTIRPGGPQPAAAAATPVASHAGVVYPTAQPASDASMTSQSDAAIMALANNDDLNVSTLAREAKKAKDEGPGKDEVVISLH